MQRFLLRAENLLFNRYRQFFVWPFADRPKKQVLDLLENRITWPVCCRMNSTIVYMKLTFQNKK